MRDRPDGEVVIYVRDNTYCKRRSDLQLQGLESVWIELSTDSKKLLINGFYRPQNSNTAYFDLLNGSIGRAYSTKMIDFFLFSETSFITFRVIMHHENTPIQIY